MHVDLKDPGRACFQSAQSILLGSYFADLLNTVDEYGARQYLEHLLWESGLTSRALLQEASARTFERYYRLLGALHQTGKTPGIGIKLGNAKTPAKFGVYGYALLACTDYEQFSNTAERIFATIYRNIETKIHVDGDRMHVSYLMVSAIDSSHVPIMDQVVTTAFALFKSLFGRILPWDRCEVRLSYSPQEYACFYDEYIPCRVRFNQPRTELVLPLDWRRLQTETGDEALALMIQGQFKTMLCEDDERKLLSDRIRRDLYRSQGSRMMSAQQTAERHHLTERTLRNVLASEGTSFRRISAEVRVDLAKRYLLETTLSIQEVSHLLGYAQVQNFYYFFGRAFGMTPERFRLRQAIG